MLAFEIMVQIVSQETAHTVTASPGGYIIGAIVALLIMFYLFYSLIKPEKF